MCASECMKDKVSHLRKNGEMRMGGVARVGVVEGKSEMENAPVVCGRPMHRILGILTSLLCLFNLSKLLSHLCVSTSTLA